MTGALNTSGSSENTPTRPKTKECHSPVQGSCAMTGGGGGLLQMPLLHTANCASTWVQKAGLPDQKIKY